MQGHPAWNKGIKWKLTIEEKKVKFGHVAHNKGIPMSKEQKLKISQSNKGKLKGKTSPLKGKHLSEEHRQNIIKNHFRGKRIR